jgi:protein ImuB
MLFASIHVPDFPVQATLRAESQSKPVALLDGPDALLKVVACNAAARDAGIAVGMTKLQAEACAEVELRKRAQEDEDAAQSALLHCAYGFSPRVEATRPGTLILDMSGSERLLGDAKHIAHLIESRTAQQGFCVNVGMAANPDAALCAARGFNAVTVISPGKESRCLGDLPVETLEPTPETLETLEAWGIRDFKSLAALPSLPLTQRLGQYGLHLQRLAQGTVQRELVPAPLPERFYESAELEEPVELLEPLAFILNRLLEKVTARLRDASLATDHIELELDLEVRADRDVRASHVISPSRQHQRALKLPVPTQDAKALLKLLQLDLASHPPTAPVMKIRLEAFPARVRVTQMGLFQPLSPEPARLEVTFARLRALVGEYDQAGRPRVGFPSLMNTHRPDSFTVEGATARHGEASPPLLCPLAFQIFRPAFPASVEVSAEGVPVWLGFARTRMRVAQASGPWQRGGNWWESEEMWQREEWDIYGQKNDEACLYRLYRDLRSGKWFVEGMYD